MRRGAGARRRWLSQPGAAMTRPASSARPRIRSADAVRVRARVEEAASALGLRCGLLAVLAAVLALLVGYKRLRDDQVAIRHVLARFPADARLLSATTIGRRLRQLAALELIVYEPARGRGRTAHLAIHPRFCADISELARNHHGKVIVSNPTPSTRSESVPEGDAETGFTHRFERPADPFPEARNVEFSARPFLLKKSPRKTPPLATATTAPSAAPCSLRPIEVDIEAGAVSRVLAALPDCYRKAPWAVRQHLHGAIRAQLARGWREGQIIDVLVAPLPAEVRKPLVLARIRFAKSLIGAGPRLRPLQRRWERANTAARQADWTASVASRYAAIVAEVGPDVAHRMAMADRHRTSGSAARHGEFDKLAQQRATVNAARAVTRDYPHEPLRVAVRRWLAIHEPASAETGPELLAPAGDLWAAIEDLVAAAPAGHCMSCGASGADIREDLPAPAPVCNGCWDRLSADDDSPVVAESPSDEDATRALLAS